MASASATARACPRRVGDVAGPWRSPRRSTPRRATPRRGRAVAVSSDDAPIAPPPSLSTWRRLLADVPLARILPRDVAFGAGMVPEASRDGERAERLAFFGDKLLNAAVADALWRQRGCDAPVGEMTALVAAAASNANFSLLLPALLRPDMVEAVPPDARSGGSKTHTVGTMVEAAAFLVYQLGGDRSGRAALAECGAFLLHAAETGTRGGAGVLGNHKGALFELIARGEAEGSLETREVAQSADATEPEAPRFVSVATLDGRRASASAGTKKEAEQRAARAVFEALAREGGATGRWGGTVNRPEPPGRAEVRDGL